MTRCGLCLMRRMGHLSRMEVVRHAAATDRRPRWQGAAAPPDWLNHKSPPFGSMIVPESAGRRW